MKVSNLDRAKILKSWSNALSADKVSEWASETLPTSLKDFVETHEPKYMLTVGESEFLLIGLSNILNDAVMVMVYDIEEGCTDTINVFTDVTGYRKLEPEETSDRELFYDKTMFVDDDHGNMEVCNRMSLPMVGMCFYKNEENALKAFIFNGLS